MRHRAIKRCLKPTFAAICRHVSWSTPFKPVFPHKATLAELVGASVSTIHNHLKALAEADLIELMPQHHNARTGKFDKSKIRLTARAAEMLGLALPDEADFQAPPSTTFGVGHKEGLTTPAFTPKEDQRATLEKNPETPNPGQQIELPLELAEACAEFEIMPAGMAKLRGEARKAGHSIANVLRCARVHLQRLALQRGRAFRYLQAMIGKQVDYAGKAEQAARVEAVAALQAQNRARAARHTGKHFASPDGLTYRVLPDAIEVLDGGTIHRRIVAEGMAEVFARIEAGELRQHVASAAPTPVGKVDVGAHMAALRALTGAKAACP